MVNHPFLNGVRSNNWWFVDFLPGKSPWNLHLSSVQNPGWLGYIRDEKLPSYIGIILSHYKDPYQPTSISWNVNRVLNVAHLFFFPNHPTLKIWE